MFRNISVVLCVLALGLVCVADEAAARGCRGGCGSCGSSCGSSCHTRTRCHSHCGSRCGSYCGSCSTCAGGVCDLGGHPVHMAAFDSPATIVVSLPADATLTINGQATTSASGTRVFEAIGLANGFDYVYTFEANVVRDGRTERISQNVVVRAGQETRVTMELPTGVASR
ncbi:MAG: TIGR03000 domain-containing protein [Gemmataceae bacterium]